MTVLVDKLEKELARNCRLNNWDLGFQAAIDIVKQHSVAPHTGAWMTTPIWKCIREIRNSGLLE